MEYPVLVILGVLAIGIVTVVLPVVLTTLADHREPKSLVCPETGLPTTVQVDAGRAARGAVIGRVAAGGPELRALARARSLRAGLSFSARPDARPARRERGRRPVTPLALHRAGTRAGRCGALRRPSIMCRMASTGWRGAFSAPRRP